MVHNDGYKIEFGTHEMVDLSRQNDCEFPHRVGRLGRKRERGHVRGSHDAEVPPIDRRDLGHAEPLGCRDHRGVHRSEPKVAVLGDELEHAQRVCGVDGLEREDAGGDLGDQKGLRLGAKPPPDQMGDFAHHERRHD